MLAGENSVQSFILMLCLSFAVPRAVGPDSLLSEWTHALPCSCTACEEQLELLKREYLPRLAREHGITEEFCSAVKVLDCPLLASIFIGRVDAQL